MTIGDATYYPVSPPQQEMLRFLGTTVDDYYVMPEIFHVGGAMDVPRLSDAVMSVVRRHSTLRTVLTPDARMCKVLAPEHFGPEQYLSLSEAGSIEEAYEAAMSWACVPMDLCAQPPLKMRVIHIDRDDYVVAVAGHHIVFDGWSFKNLYDEIDQAYRGGEDRVPIIRPYSDVIAGISGSVDDLRVPYEIFGLNYGRLRDVGKFSNGTLGPAGYLRCHEGPQASSSLMEFARIRRVTPYVVMAAAMLLALKEMCGTQAAILGTASTGRTSGDAVRSIGFFSNTVFMATVADDFDAAVQNVSNLLAKWHASPRIQWDEIASRFGAGDLYGFKFAFSRAEMAHPDIRIAGCDVHRLDDEEVPLGGQARRPVDAQGTYSSDGVTFDVKYRADVFAQEEVQQLVTSCLSRVGDAAHSHTGES